MIYQGSGTIDPRRRVRTTVPCSTLATWLKRGTAAAVTTDVPADAEVVRVRQKPYSKDVTLDVLSATFPIVPDGQPIPEKDFKYT